MTETKAKARPMLTPVFKQDVADMAKRLRAHAEFMPRASEREDLASIAATLETLAEYCSVAWPIIIERKK